MVLAIKQPWIVHVRREHIARALVWLLFAAMVWGFAYNYFADGLPSPYGLCYVGRDGSKPCPPPVKPKTVDARTLPVAKTP